jgi:pSer/pThr/pTyr-binding forkhead associated (FHA) protein
MERTHEMAVTTATERAVVPAAPPGRPFLILEGRRHVDLLQPTVSIGRALDNDIIVEDSRVSRHHAQLRRRFDRFVLYDLGSRGGTEINGYPVEECVLHAGDVISLAGVEVIYGEDLPPTVPMPDKGDTPVLEPTDHEQE